ncbi:MAG TPA: DUF5666 domain-containing protein [Candidatus Acidoferrum sp.]|nr:DUF5666 domain-containing protein [Candidatus Acidoferrum sp.]
MKNQIAKITLFGLVAAALALTPTFSYAQDATNAPAAQTPTPKKHKVTPFHGKVDAVDASAQTLTVGTLTISITSKTKISNTASGEPAMLSDITVGEFVSGAYKKSKDGTLQATTIHIGKKAAKTKKSTSADVSSTNAVPN